MSLESLPYEQTDWNKLNEEIGTTDSSRIDALETQTAQIATNGQSLSMTGNIVGANVLATNETRVKKNESNYSLATKIKGLLTAGNLSFTVLGDSTECGVGAGGGVYAQITSSDYSGYADKVAYNLIKSDIHFIPLSSSVKLITLGYGSKYATLANTAPPSWQFVVSDDESISFEAVNSQRVLSDQLTIYYNSRTSDSAARIQLTVKDSEDNVLYQDMIDSYVDPIDFGVAGTVDVVGRIKKETITLNVATKRNLFITLDSPDVIDRGSGAAADGTIAIYGFAFNNGVDFHNLAVSSTTLTSPSSANTTRGITTEGRLSLAQSYDTNLYLIGWGTNDSKTGVTTESQFETDYKAFIDSIRATEPNAVIILSTDPRGATGSIYENNSNYNSLIRQIASDKSCYLFDVEELSDISPSTFYGDDVHPSQVGHTILAQALSDMLGIPNNNDSINTFQTSGSTSFAAKGGVASITEGLTDFTGSFVEVISTGAISRPSSAVGLFICVDVNVANTSAIDQCGLVIKLNGSIIDEKLASFPLIGSYAIGVMSSQRVYELGASTSYTISVEMKNYLIRSSNASSYLSWIWL